MEFACAAADAAANLGIGSAQESQLDLIEPLIEWLLPERTHVNTSALLEWDIKEEISGVASSSGRVGRVGEPMTSLGDLTDQTTYLLDPASLADEDGKRWRIQLNVTASVGNRSPAPRT